MTITQNQLFYAALFWLEALPGSEVFSASIAEKYNMLYIPTGAPQREPGKDEDMMPFMFDKTVLYKKLHDGVTEEEAEIFFEIFYDALTRRPPEPHYDMVGQLSTYIGLGRGALYNRDHGTYLYAEAIELGLAAAGLSRELFPMISTYLHDNGQIFTQHLRDVRELNYPGRPAPDFKSYPKMTYDDVVATGRAKPFQFEIFYRIIPVEEGKSYDIAHDTISGKPSVMPWTAGEGDVMIIRGGDALGAFSDAELIARAAKEPIGAHITQQAEYAPGAKNKTYGYTVSATTCSNVVRYLSKPFLAIDVTEKTQLFFGASFFMAASGDKLIVEGRGYAPSLMTESILEKCATRMLPAEPPKKSAPRPGPNPKI